MEIYVSKDGAQAGPFPVEEVEKMVAGGQIAPTDHGWHDGLPDWVPLSSILGVGPNIRQSTLVLKISKWKTKKLFIFVVSLIFLIGTSATIFIFHEKHSDTQLDQGTSETSAPATTPPSALKDSSQPDNNSPDVLGNPPSPEDLVNYVKEHFNVSDETAAHIGQKSWDDARMLANAVGANEIRAEGGIVKFYIIQARTQCSNEGFSEK